MKSIQLFVVLCVLSSVSSWASFCSASPKYPSIVRDSEMMVTEADDACTPQCTLCHTNNSGGSGTANQPFSITLIQFGLIGDSEESLYEALAALNDDDSNIDSDMDGRSDLVELRTPAAELAGLEKGGAWDPNVIGPGAICADLPRYGCGAQFAVAEPRQSLVWALGLLIIGVVLSRRLLSRLKA